MTYKGDFKTGSTIRHMWVTNGVGGESITRATNGTISVYKDGGTTQTTTGVTDTEDFDSLTGVHLVAIDTSADGTFYSSGSEFHVVLSGAVIDGKSINAVLFSFSIENRSAIMSTSTDLASLADAVHDEVVEDSTTFRQATRLQNSALLGKASGMATTTAVFRDIGDTKDRISATVDADGNRTAVTLDGS